jgi:hypothetical protein
MRVILPAALAAMLLASCALFEPEPCTRDYFVFQSERLQRDFARRNRGEVRRLQTLRQDINGNLDVFTALAVVSAKRDLQNLVADLRQRVVPDARSIADQCGIDGAFDLMVDGFLLKQGIDPQLVRTLQLTGLFEDPVLESTLEPGTNTLNP